MGCRHHLHKSGRLVSIIGVSELSPLWSSRFLSEEDGQVDSELNKKCKSVAVIPVRVMIVIAVYCREAQCGNERSNNDSREPTFWKDQLTFCC